MVLSRGNTKELDAMYRDFTGHDPEIAPMLKHRGLAGAGKPETGRHPNDR
jgi:peptidyl-dipeptidase Dcp